MIAKVLVAQTLKTQQLADVAAPTSNPLKQGEAALQALLNEAAQGPVSAAVKAGSAAVLAFVGNEAKAEVHTVPRLTTAEAKARLATLPGWSIEGDELVKRFAPKGFKKAVAFANDVAALAATARHHPDILIGFGKAELRMTTHDAGGLSAKDFDLACAVEAQLAAAAAAAAAAPAPVKKSGSGPLTTPMSPAVALSAQERASLPSQLGAGWKLEGEELVLKVPFKGFKTALAFLNSVAAIADAQRHHPDIAIGFGKAEIRTTTHDAGGLSPRDVALALAVNSLSG